MSNDFSVYGCRYSGIVVQKLNYLPLYSEQREKQRGREIYIQIEIERYGQRENRANIHIRSSMHSPNRKLHCSIHCSIYMCVCVCVCCLQLQLQERMYTQHTYSHTYILHMHGVHGHMFSCSLISVQHVASVRAGCGHGRYEQVSDPGFMTTMITMNGRRVPCIPVISPLMVIQTDVRKRLLRQTHQMGQHLVEFRISRRISSKHR